MNTTTNTNDLISFFEQVVHDLKHNQCSKKQIAECSRFYINYTTNSIPEGFTYDEMDCVTAGIAFYSTLVNGLDLVKHDLKDEN